MDERAILIKWFFFCVGVTYFIVSSGIFSPLRILLARKSSILRYFLYCPFCVSFWVGIISSVIGIYPLSVSPITSPIELGFISMAIVGIVSKSIDMFSVSEEELSIAGFAVNKNDNDSDKN